MTGSNSLQMRQALQQSDQHVFLDYKSYSSLLCKMPDMSTIRLSITLTLASFSHLISSARLVYRWRFQTRLPRTLDYSPTASYPDQHPKSFFWQMSLFILFTSTATAVLSVLAIVQNEPYDTVLAALIIVASCFHEVCRFQSKSVDVWANPSI